MIKLKSFRFSVFSIIVACIAGMLFSLYIFETSFASVTNGEAKEVFLLWQMIGYGEDEKQEVVENALQELEEWAKDYRTTVLVMPIDGIGVAIADYSGWILENYGGDYTGGITGEILLAEQTDFGELFAKEGGVLLKGNQYHVAGTFQKEGKAVYRGREFFYPLRDCKCQTESQGCLMHIYGARNNEIEQILGQLEKMGIMYSYVSPLQEGQGYFEEIRIILEENRTAVLLLILATGLFVCAAMALISFYKSAAKELKIMHLYGATYCRLGKTIGGYCIGASGCGCIVGFLVGMLMFEGMQLQGALKIGKYMGCFSLVLVFILYGTSYLNWYLHQRRQEGGF